MIFEITLAPPSGDVSPKTDSIDSSDFDTLVMDACKVLADTDCHFAVSGFGKNSWFVDIEYDLSSVIQQMPDILKKTRENESASLYFFGQGVDTLLEFNPTNTGFRINCRPGTGWQPYPSSGHVSKEDLDKMFTSFTKNFAESLTKIAPEISRKPPFLEWKIDESKNG